MSLYSYTKVGNLVGIMNLVSEGKTDTDKALVLSSYYGNDDIIKYLISKGAKSIDKALKWAAFYGELETVKILIFYGGTELDTALRMACKNNCMTVVDYLIQQGADPAIAINAFAGDLGHKYRKRQIYFGEITNLFCGVCFEPLKKTQEIIQCNDCKQCVHLVCVRKTNTLMRKSKDVCLSCKVSH